MRKVMNEGGLICLINFNMIFALKFLIISFKR